MKIWSARPIILKKIQKSTNSENNLTISLEDEFFSENAHKFTIEKEGKNVEKVDNSTD